MKELEDRSENNVKFNDFIDDVVKRELEHHPELGSVGDKMGYIGVNAKIGVFSLADLLGIPEIELYPYSQIEKTIEMLAAAALTTYSMQFIETGDFLVNSMGESLVKLKNIETRLNQTVATISIIRKAGNSPKEVNKILSSSTINFGNMSYFGAIRRGKTAEVLAIAERDFQILMEF